MNRAIKGLLFYVIYWVIIQQGPHAYNAFNCVEPEPGYAQRLFYYLTDTEIQKICPTIPGLIWSIGGEVCYILLSVLASQLLKRLSSDRDEEWWPSIAAVFLGQWREDPLSLAQRRMMRMGG